MLRAHLNEYRTFGLKLVCSSFRREEPVQSKVSETEDPNVAQEMLSDPFKMLCFSSLYMNMYILYQYACLYYVHIVAVQQLKTIFFMRWNFHYAR